MSHGRGSQRPDRHFIMSLARKIFRGSALNAADLLLRMGVMFLMTPFLVSKLGMEGYGSWVVLTTAVSFLDLMDGGITLSGTRFLARTIGSKDEAAYIETAGTLSWLYRRIGWLSLLGTVILVLGCGFFVKDSHQLEESRFVLAVLGFSLALRFFLRIHLVVLKSHVRYDLIVASGLVKLVFQTGLIVALLLNGYGLMMLAVAQISSDVLDQVLVVIFSKRTGTAAFEVRPSKARLREVLSYSSTIFLNTLGQFLRSRLDALVLSLTTGVLTVPVYNTGMRLLTLYGDIMNAIIGGPLLAGFCQVEGSSGLAVLRQKFLQSMRFSVPLAVLGAVGLFAYGPTFLMRWMGPEFADSGTILRLLIGVFALWLMQLPATSILLALNRHQVLMKATLLAGVFNLVVSLILAWKIGFYGVVVASLIEMAVFYGLLVPHLAADALNMPLRSYYRQALVLPIICSALPLIIYVNLTQSWLLADYARLALLSCGLTLTFLMSFVLFVLSANERRSLVIRLWRRRCF